MGRSRAPAAAAAAAAEEEESAQAASRSKRRRVAAAPPEPWELALLAAGSDGKRGLYHCNYCQKDISSTVRIKCARCADFDLCVECFSVGAELKPHKSTHPYHVMDNLSFPFFYPDWNADEEILLLEGVEMYGLGNWNEVAEHIGSKSSEQCYMHYMASYMYSPYSPLPDMTHVAGKTKAELSAISKQEPLSRGPTPPREGAAPSFVKQETGFASLKMEEVKEEKPKTPEFNVTGSKSFPPILSAGEGEFGGGGSAGGGEGGAKKSAAAGMAAGGGGGGEEDAAAATSSEGGDQQQSKRTLGASMPKGGPMGGAEQDKLGAAAIEQTGYNPKRNEFDPEYDNDAEVPLAEMEFKDTDSATDRELKIRMLEIYSSRLDERKRRKEFILERGLLNLRKQQALDRRRSKEEKELYQRGRVFARYLSPEEHEAWLNGLNVERKIRQRIEELQEYRSAGCRTLAEAEQYELEKRKRETEQSLRKARENPSHPHGKNNPRARQSSRERSDGGGGRSGGRKASTPLDLKGHLGTELLSLQEREICSLHRLLPVHYLKMKEALLTLGAQKGLVTREEARRMFKVDPLKTQAVLSFIAAKGWVQSDISAPSGRKSRREALAMNDEQSGGGSGSEAVGERGERGGGEAGEDAEGQGREGGQASPEFGAMAMDGVWGVVPQQERGVDSGNGLPQHHRLPEDPVLVREWLQK